MADITSIDVSPGASGFAPLTINYTVNVSSLGPYTIFVDFGDGNDSTNETGSHTYTNPGSYTLYASVEDTDEPFESDEASTSITVENSARKRGAFFSQF